MVRHAFVLIAFNLFCFSSLAQTTTRVSVDSSGIQGNDLCYTHSISADGRYVAFDSHATNLVPGDTNASSDVFVHDNLTGTTRRVSVDSNGTQANGISSYVVISADGHFVAFASAATNLVPGDTNGNWDVFEHDMVNGTTTRVSVSSSGAQAFGGDSGVYGLSISADGRYVAFQSSALNLASPDFNGSDDVFVHDRVSGITTRVSVASNGT